ncbi:lamin tail domain-containing protein [Candidatus Neomarinimicrobiota bacterium]
MKISIIQKLSLILLFSVSFNLAQIPDIVINEFLTSNAHINYDPDYRNYSDWLELYNNENYSINLNGYYLTDDLTNPTKWKITNDITIEPYGYLVFWADNEDTEIHTNFQLNVDGEQIGLYMPDGSVVDEISFQSQKTDISRGRNTSNTYEWLYYYDPTPGNINNTIGNIDLVTCSPPIFSETSGFYTTDLSLEIMPEQGAEIRYTLDGSEPNENSEKYSVAINISDRLGESNYFSEIPTNINPFSWIQPWVPPVGNVRKATIVRAKTFSPGKLPSNIATHTYFIGSFGSEIEDAFNPISVISLISEEKHLFSDSAGIYVPGDQYTGKQGTGNYMQDWNKPAHIQFFDENGDLKISQEVDIRIQGATTPANPQKGLHIIARDKYGKNSIEYPFFRNSKSKANKLTSFKRFMIRAWGAPGWNAGMVNDALAQTSYARSSLDIQDYCPTIVFINGEYWGLQAIREANKNPYYFEGHYGVDKDDPGFDILVGGTGHYYIDEGDDVHWKNMIDFIDNNDLSITQNYEYLRTLMDVDNFIDYIGHCVYMAKKDWPVQNEAFWRPRTADGRWKWIQYDMDTCLSGSDYNMLDHVFNGTNERPLHALLLELIKNDNFKLNLINWFMDRINSDFKPEIINNNNNKMLNDIYPYLTEHLNRWALSNSNFGLYTTYIRNFISLRPDSVISHLQSYFNLGELNTVMIDSINNGGTVKINSLFLNEHTPGTSGGIYGWSGKYFEDVPIALTAIPNDGFVFDHWVGSFESESESITFTPSQIIWLAPVFSIKEKTESLYINEVLVDNKNINTDSAGEYDDWIELYNAGSDTINLEGLYFTDDFTKPTKWKIPVIDSIPFSISPNEYKIIWCDNEAQEGQDHVGFSLNKKGENIGLLQIVGNDTVFIDSLSFSEQLPNISYGRLPDASDKWELLLKPSPGSKNIYLKYSDKLLSSPQLFQNYPNPFNISTRIPYYLTNINVNDVTIDIYNIKGKLVRSHSNKQKEVGYSEFLWDGRDNYGNTMSSGIYFYHLRLDDFRNVKKMLYLK